MSGWFSVNRAMLDHPIFAGQPMRIAAWVWIVGSAAWKDTKQDANGQTVTVKRGQLLTSYRQMSEASGVSVKTLRNLLDRLEAEGAITRECIGHKHGTGKGTARTVITIRNYDKYQQPERNGGTGKGTAGAQQGHTKEQGNNNTPSNEGDAQTAPKGETVEVSLLSTAVWSTGKPFLASRGVKNPGAVIGRWLKSHSPPEILSAMELAQKVGTQDPIPYITQILNGGFNDNRTGTQGYSQPNSTDRSIAIAARFTRAPSEDCF